MNQIISCVKEKVSLVQQHVSGKMLTSGVVGTAMVLGTSLSTFADGEVSALSVDSLPSVSITADMLKPLVEGVVASVGTILPVGLGLFAIFLGIRIIPGLISRFVHMQFYGQEDGGFLAAVLFFQKGCIVVNYNPYIPWDVDFFYSAILQLRGVIGTAFNIGFWIFIIISGVYLVLKIVDQLGGQWSE